MEGLETRDQTYSQFDEAFDTAFQVIEELEKYNHKDDSFLPSQRSDEVIEDAQGELQEIQKKINVLCMNERN